jgi:hypothetical protein
VTSWPTVDQQLAEMGVLMAIDEVTPGMTEVARKSGVYHRTETGRDFAKVQIITVRDLLVGKKVQMPTPFLPYLQAARFAPPHPTLPGF